MQTRLECISRRPFSRKRVTRSLHSTNHMEATDHMEGRKGRLRTSLPLPSRLGSLPPLSSSSPSSATVADTPIMVCITRCRRCQTQTDGKKQEVSMGMQRKRHTDEEATSEHAGAYTHRGNETCFQVKLNGSWAFSICIEMSGSDAPAGRPLRRKVKMERKWGIFNLSTPVAAKSPHQ